MAFKIGLLGVKRLAESIEASITKRARSIAVNKALYAHVCDPDLNEADFASNLK